MSALTPCPLPTSGEGDRDHGGRSSDQVIGRMWHESVEREGGAA